MNNRLRPTSVVRDEPPAPQLPEPPIKPQLLWPSIKYGGRESEDSLTFPEKQYIHERHARVNNDMKLVAFEDAVIESEAHILVLDPHFDAISFNVQGNRIINDNFTEF